VPSGGLNDKRSALWSTEQAKKDDHENSMIHNYEVITEANQVNIGTRYGCNWCNFVTISIRQFECHLKTHRLRAGHPEAKSNNPVARTSALNPHQLNLPGMVPSSDVALQDHTYSKP